VQWVFVKKYNEKGECRFRARLVIGGHRQRQGLDYVETFASTVRYETVRLVLDIASKHDYEVHQIDYVAAFLNARHKPVGDKTYASFPDGVSSDLEDYVMEVLGAIYGLKQSPRDWEIHRNKIMAKFGFKPLLSDASAYTDGKLIIAVWVDDCIIAGKDLAAIVKWKKDIAGECEIKDMGELTSILGMQWVRDRANKKSWLHQSAYTQTILRRFKMDKSHPEKSPATYDPSPDITDRLINTEEYLQAVGALIHLSKSTRPDIAFAVSAVASKMKSPTSKNWNAVKRIFRYLNGTRNYGIMLGGQIDDRLVCYADADWAGDHDTRRSRSGHVVFYGNSPISWYSKLQTGTHSLSSVESEYKSAVYGAQDLMWLQNIMGEFNVKASLNLLCNARGVIAGDLKCDNQGAIAAMNNPMQHSKLKHVELRYHFIREAVKTAQLNIEYVRSSDMIADILTKSLTPQSFCPLRSKLGVEMVPFEKANERKE
jgi:hypothetical protein